MGTISVSQSRVSTTVWRQRISRTLPCLPLSSWIQSPTWIEPSSCRATPPITFPSVVCRESARDAAHDRAWWWTTPEKSSPAPRRTTMVLTM